MAVVRRSVTVPAAGATTEIPVSGEAVIVESGAHTTPADVPTIHLDNPSGSPFPAYPAAALDRPFHRFYVKGTAAAAGSTLYLLIRTICDLEIRMPNTVEHA